MYRLDGELTKALQFPQETVPTGYHRKDVAENVESSHRQLIEHVGAIVTVARKFAASCAMSRIESAAVLGGGG
jgi:hypothetical protein